MAFDRKEYGMNSGIPFIKIADPVEVTIKDRKSTRLNSSHGYISYAVFCLKKKIPDIHPHDLATLVDREGIAVRAGHHCTHPLMDRLVGPATTRAGFHIYKQPDDADTLHNC